MTIKTSNLGKRFNREWIFNGLSAEFETGKTYAITGPNGSGKSTLMQVLWGQVPPSEGTISYKKDGTEIPADEVFRHIAIATPYMDLIEEFTLLEHIEFHLKFKKSGNSQSAQEIIERMQLEGSGEKPIRQFSSGMKQRVKLGLALFSGCEILFLDEPSTNLDASSIDWYMGNLLEFGSGKLVFIATNQSADLPEDALGINLKDLKRVTNLRNHRIQTS